MVPARMSVRMSVCACGYQVDKNGDNEIQFSEFFNIMTGEIKIEGAKIPLRYSCAIPPFFFPSLLLSYSISLCLSLSLTHSHTHSLSVQS
eukprot:COSAG05_NODE_130_length_17165_cov_154.623638_27_plen_90_part_00